MLHYYNTECLIFTCNLNSCIAPFSYSPATKLGTMYHAAISYRPDYAANTEVIVVLHGLAEWCIERISRCVCDQIDFNELYVTRCQN